jgi:serine/threonine-protein kinase
MPIEQRISEIIEEMMESGATAEQACADHPELLEAVKARLSSIQRIDSELTALFPAMDGRSSRASGRRHRLFGVASPGGELPRVPGYELQSVLGSGGMGVVYRAWHVKLQRPVAIKMLLAGAYASDQELACLLREAQVVASLRHPNIVQVHDVGEIDGLPYFSMEFLDGGTLAKKLAGIPQPAREAAELTVMLAEAVDAAHRNGVVHRDLKPANILLTSDGSPKVADFSLARTFGSETSLSLQSARIGTPSYMAPEQVLGSPAAFYPTVDVYSLGAILYECLTGRPPFHAETPEATHRQVLEAEPAAPSRLNAGVPRDLETICLKCLQRQPDQRYATAAALAADVRRFLNGEPIRARPVSTLERSWRWVRRNRAASAFTASLLLCAGLATFAGLREWRTQAIQRGEEARWADRLSYAVSLQQQGRLGEAQAILLGGSDSVSKPMQERIESARADLAFAERLDAIRLSRGKFMPGGGIDYAHSSQSYAMAFKEGRLGAVGDPSDQVAAALSESPIRLTIIAALDDWAACASAEDRAWVLAVCRQMDPDPWRDRVRDQRTWADLNAIADAAATVDVDHQPVTLMVALGTRWRRLGGDPLRYLERVQRRYPSDFWVNFELGHLYSSRDRAAAIGYCRAALAVRPNAEAAHYNLGVNLKATGLMEEASTHFKATLAVDNDHTWARLNLAQCLTAMGNWAEATEQMQRVRAEAPSDAEVWRAFRDILLRQRRVEQALADWQSWLSGGNATDDDLHGYAELSLFAGDMTEYQRACVKLLSKFEHSDNPRTCERVGRACALGPVWNEVSARGTSLIDRALMADPSRNEPWAQPYFLVAKALSDYRQGHYELAISRLQGEAATTLGPAPSLIIAMSQHRLGDTKSARRTLARAVAMFDWRSGLELDVTTTYHVLRIEAESLIVPNIGEYFQDRYEPKDISERLAMLGACAAQNRNLAAVGLYRGVFTSAPEYAEDLSNAMRYNAACVAALAGCGQGVDAPRVATEREELRMQALNWLRADLRSWDEHINARESDNARAIGKRLEHWLKDPDLSGVRDGDALDQLSNEERDRWRAFWKDVEASLLRARVFAR